MATSSRNSRRRGSGSPNQVNLVSARSRSNTEVSKLSRINSADGYAQARRKRTHRRNVLIGIGVTLASLFLAAVAAVGAYALIINGKLGTDIQGNQTDFTTGAYENVFVAPQSSQAPFWMLLMGVDGGFDDPNVPDVGRSDTLILVRVDQANKQIALLSIPRDTYVTIPGYGQDKINAAYAYGEAEQTGGGVPLAIKTVSQFAGVDISYFAQVNFQGLVKLVDDLGGVQVDVPVDIVGDTDSGDFDLYAGLQVLDGPSALKFCRSRDFPMGDYQRQADQRTFLQATAKQVLASDPATIAKSVTNMADMTFTNMNLTTIIQLAQSFQGLQEDSIHTYYLPSTTSEMNGISYVIADDTQFPQLIQSIASGNYPPPQDDNYSGVVPDSYVASSTTTTDQLAGQTSQIQPSKYVVDVRNGFGVSGSAQSVADMLSIAGYQEGEVGNANAYVYNTTLVIYKDPANKQVAEDIRQRLGYGKTLSSDGLYTFDGDILVVVGADFKG